MLRQRSAVDDIKTRSCDMYVKLKQHRFLLLIAAHYSLNSLPLSSFYHCFRLAAAAMNRVVCYPQQCSLLIETPM